MAILSRSCVEHDPTASFCPSTFINNFMHDLWLRLCVRVLMVLKFRESRKRNKVAIYQLGNRSLRSSFSELVNFSGNLMSKAMRRSPFRAVSFGCGSPYPCTRFTVFGLMISCIVLIRSLSPSSVGTSNTTPQRACK